MSELVKLVNEWDRFEKEHPQSAIEDFCRYYLINKQKEKEVINDAIPRPPNTDSVTSKTIGRLAGILDGYFKIAYRDDPQMELESALFLNAVYLHGEARKSDVIHYNFAEQSTGIDILSRLKKMGFISERDDPDDKRAKLVKVTPQGEEKVLGFWEKASKISLVVFSDLGEDDKKLINQLLMPVESKHTKILPEVRQKNINEIMDTVLGAEKAKTMREEIEGRMKIHRDRLKHT